MKTKTDKTMTFLILLGLAIAFFMVMQSPLEREAALHRTSLLATVTNPQQITNARVAFLIVLPVIAAYVFFMKSETSLDFKAIWNNLGAKMGLVAGFLSIFVLQHQIAFYIVTIIFMTAWGMWLVKKKGANALTAFLIPFVPAYYYMLVQIWSTNVIQLVSLFNAATIAIFIWIIPIMASMFVYSAYKGYIPRLKTQLMRWNL